ncbi:MAG TPA: isoamylase [bacterium]|nr:isoamylase [bacterium]
MPDLSGQLRTIEKWETDEGVPFPIGATWVDHLKAYNFSLFSKYATGVTLLCYTKVDRDVPVYEYRFDPHKNKTGRIWHCWIPAEEMNGATLYAYRVEGPHEPSAGHRFDDKKILLDPLAKEVWFPPEFDRSAAIGPGANDGKAPLGVLPKRQKGGFEWRDNVRPRHTSDAIVYELHVKGFTARKNSGVTPAKRGTFAALIEKIPYLQELGVTIVELMPVHQFDPREGNYWGYMTLNFFAPHAGYATGSPMEEFREMVRAFHKAGIEVWLDVVYNHTCEGDARGPTYSYRGIDNHCFYLLEQDRSRYVNDAGCGNVLRVAHPTVRIMIIESLRYWARMMRVDGFRFDLASIFTRNNDGSVNVTDPALVIEIGWFAYMNDIALTAEAWDIASYQLGRTFPGMMWRQWNGKFRDDVRQFVKSDAGMVGALMRRLYGSDDLFPDAVIDASRPVQSVNFITAHDGFCLYDLVSYNQKHNKANGNNNTDGADNNLSWNCGHEGDRNVPAEVMELRRRQVKNFFTILMLANGTPMFCAGDEFMNTQKGNNNPYNQDNETTWLDWSLLDKNRDMFRFFKLMIAFRKAHPSISRSRFWRDDVSWYGPNGGVDLGHGSRTLAYCLRGASQGDGDIYVMINAFWEDVDFTVQEGKPGEWSQAVDTAMASPDDICETGNGKRLHARSVKVKARSIVVLERQQSKEMSD